jgi:hypothetical protein
LSTGTSQNVGLISGTGDTGVAAGSDLTADGIVQNALIIGGAAGNLGHVTIRPNSGNVVMAADPEGAAGGLIASSLAPATPFGSASAGGSGAFGSLPSDSPGGLASSPASGMSSGSTSVPEPATWCLALLALGALPVVGRRIRPCGADTAHRAA